jgi:hypothetical protein
MICQGGPLNGLLLHSTRIEFRLVTSNGAYWRRKDHWEWVSYDPPT